MFAGSFSSFSTGRRNNAPTGYKMANHEETFSFGLSGFFSFADVWAQKDNLSAWFVDSL